MKIWRIIKAVLYCAAAVLVVVFREQFIDYLKYAIGGLMIAYGSETIALHFIEKKSFRSNNKFFWGVMEVVLGFALVAFMELGEPESIAYATTCTVWAVWAILREAVEIEESVMEMIHGIPKFLSLIESIVAIILSILLILEPGEHHARIHGYLLIIELVTTGALFPYLSLLFERIREKRMAKKKDKE